MSALLAQRSLQTQPAAVVRGEGRAPFQQRLSCRRPTAVRTAAVASQKNTEKSVLKAVQARCDNFLQRYDVLSAGMGAMVCTSWCVWNGQDTTTALWITAASTVAALVVNETVFNDDC